MGEACDRNRKFSLVTLEYNIWGGYLIEIELFHSRS